MQIPNKLLKVWKMSSEERELSREEFEKNYCSWYKHRIGTEILALLVKSFEDDDKKEAEN